MAGRYSVVQQMTRADVFRVAGLLRHHPDTTLRAALALAFPEAGTSTGDGARVLVGPPRAEPPALCVPLTWDVRVGSEGWSRFAGELRLTPAGEGARLSLVGHVRGTAHLVDDAGLERLVGWLALAADAGSSPSGS